MNRQNPQGSESPDPRGRTGGGQNPDRSGGTGTGESPERFGATGGEGPGRTGRSGATGEGGTEQSKGTRGTGPSGQSTGTSLMGNDIIGRHVRLQSGEDIGEIEDLVVETKGRVLFAVVTGSGDGSPGSATGTRGTAASTSERGGGREGSSRTAEGGGSHLIPWAALQSGTGASGNTRDFTVKFDREKFTTSPKFDRNRTGDLNNAQLQSRIYQHFGLSPEGDGPSGRSGQGMESDRGRGSKGQQRPGEERSTTKPTRPEESGEDDA